MMKQKRYDLKSSRLFLALEQGDIKTVIEQMDSGISVEILDLDGNTPLIRASFLGCVDLVDRLVGRGANVNAFNDIGYSALHFAAQEGYKSLAEILINGGAKVDALDANGNTPLSNAIYYEKEELVKLLIAAGASLDLPNQHGVSPRELAESMGFSIWLSNGQIKPLFLTLFVARAA